MKAMFTNISSANGVSWFFSHALMVWSFIALNPNG